MTTISPLPRPISHAGLASLFLLALALAARPVHAAPAIPNPSFEANVFANPLGYVAGNTPITGWTANPTNRIGQNVAGNTFFANNGAIPNGTRVAFIESHGFPSTLSTTLTGLVAGTSYRVQFRANAKVSSENPVTSIQLNGGAPVNFSVTPVNSNGVFTNPYHTVNAIFTATGTTAALAITNSTVDNSALLVDNFTISAATPIQVTNANNDGPGSLRQALAAAAATPAFNVITFATALNGQTITLLSEIAINDAGGVVIDASALVSGITISGGNTNRILSIASGTLASLRSLTLTGGNGATGGAILNAGTMALTRCTVSGNSSTDDAGATSNSGTLALTQCTFSGNSAINDGGAIRSSGALTLTHCTFAGNSAGIAGGAIRNDGTMTLDRSIVAGSSGAGDDIFNNGTLDRVGANVVQVIAGGGSATGTGSIDTTDPKLDVLAGNGGPTLTLALLPGSPARDAAVGSTISSDQRGKPRVGTADIGAYEVQSGGTFVFSQTGYSVNETTGPATTTTVTIRRTGGFAGAASVKISTAFGTAGASDLSPITNQVVDFADGDASKDVPITIKNDPIPEVNESFKATLSAPSAGSTVGTPASATVVIRDDDSAPDTVAPSVPVITTPAANTVVNVGADGKIAVTGTAKDDKGVSSVVIRDKNDNLLANAALSEPFAISTGWTAAITPAPGANTIKVSVLDTGGNPSPTATRSFKALVPLNVQIAGNGSVTPAGYTPRSFRDVGLKYTLTAMPAATPSPGSLFKNWSVESRHSLGNLGIPASALEKPTLTFIFREGLVLRANFAPNPYALGANSAAPGLGTNSAGVSGVEYCGLIHADPLLPDPSPYGGVGTMPANSTEGLLKTNVMSSGAFSASLLIDGTELKMAGAFDTDGVARFGTSRATTFAVARANKPSLIVSLKIDLDPGRAKDAISGTVTAKGFRQSVTEAVSKVKADRAYYDGLTPATTVPAVYLGAANANQNYTAVLPSRALYSGPLLTVTTWSGGPHGGFVEDPTSSLLVGDQIAFAIPSPTGVSTRAVYLLADDDDISPADNFFALKDADGDYVGIHDLDNGGSFAVYRPGPESDASQTPGTSLTLQDFPQGDGYAFLTITKAGVVTLTAGKLADGSGWMTASTKLSKENKFPLFLQLYGKSGYLSGDVALDNTQAGSDLAAASMNLDWMRPFDPTQHYYPYGWEESIRVGFTGARYAAGFNPASSVLRLANGTPLPDPDPENGNAGLSFFDGQLTDELDRTVSITAANVVTNVPANDTSFTLMLTPGTGLFKGLFVHETDDGAPIPLKTSYEGVIYQKGPDAGGYGFFLTRQPTPIDYTGESGAVNLSGLGP